MFEFFGKRKPSPTEHAPQTGIAQLDVMIADIEARIANGTHVSDDARLLEKYKAERNTFLK